MIRRCSCGNFKTVQPYRNAKEIPWLCDHCVDRTAAKARFHAQKATEAAIKVETVVAIEKRKTFRLVRS